MVREITDLCPAVQGVAVFLPQKKKLLGFFPRRQQKRPVFCWALYKIVFKHGDPGKQEVNGLVNFNGAVVFADQLPGFLGYE